MQSDARVLIVGAGIAGLTLANALNRVNVTPVLVEAAPTLEPIGLGLSLQPNGVRALDHIGLGSAVVERAVVSERMVVTDAAEQPLRTLDLTQAGRTVGIHRTALIDVLGGALDADIRLSTTVTSLSASRAVAEVELSDGTAGRFDLVVGADGLRSDTRDRLFPSAVLEYRGYRAWRAVVDREPADLVDSVLRWSRNAGVGTFPVTDELMYAFFLEHGPDDDDSAAEPWRHARRVAAGFGPVAQSIAGRIEENSPLIYTPVYEVQLESWRVGPVVLIGDAAHAIVPMLAQGAALAIEDAVLLARHLDAAPTALEGIANYEAARRPRMTEAAAICGFASQATGLEGTVDPAVLADHPGNPQRYDSPAAPQLRLWAGIDADLHELA